MAAVLFVTKTCSYAILFVDSKAYGLPSYITTWLLKSDCWRWCIHLESQGSPNQVEGKIFGASWGTNGSPKIQLFWATPTGNCPSILHWVVYGPWIEAFGIYNKMLKWNGFDWIVSQTWIYHCTIWKLPWSGPRRGPWVTCHRQEQPTTHDAAPSNIQDSSIFHAKVASKVICKPQNGEAGCPGLCFQNLY